MKKFVLLGLMLCAATSFANITSDDAFKLNNNMGGVASEVQLGTLLQQTKNMQVATFDATSGKGIGAYNLDISLPIGSVVKKVWYDVITTFTSSTDAATIALNTQTANDLVTAVAISDGTNPWDAGIHDGIPVYTAATAIKLTAARTVTVTVGSQSLTAGKLRVFVEYARSI